MAHRSGTKIAFGNRATAGAQTDRYALIKATDVAIWVVTTLPAVPPVRKQKSIAFSMLSPKIKIFGDPVKKVLHILANVGFFLYLCTRL